MPSSLFHLGREKDLCLAELLVFHKQLTFFDIGDMRFAKVENANPDLLNRLGGTIKISEILKELPASMPINLTEIIPQELAKCKPAKGKLIYGISIHQSNTGLLKKLLKAAKTHLSKSDISSRYLNQEGKNLSSIQSANCVEFNLIFTDQKIYLTKTTKTQDIASYSHRDYDRPARDDRSGMLPPKLAQIMINLANPTPDTIVYDPFCGSGTILQEAMMMGLTCIGSDISEKAIKDSGSNLHWLEREFAPKGKCNSLRVIDAKTLDYKDLKSQIAIVTETYLGPPQITIPSKEEAISILESLENLYLDFLSTPIPSGTKVVIAIPFFNLEGKAVYVPNLIYKIENLNYSVPAYFDDRPEIKFLTYARKNQVIGRMILTLVKK